MAIRREEAFVLKRSPVRETSLLVTLFSRGSGKIKVLAKGVRREKNPLSANLEPFTRLTAVYYEKVRSDTHLASEMTVLDSNSYICSHLDRFSYASYLVELIDALFGIHDSHPEVFDLLGSSFVLLQSVPAVRIARVFEIKLLEEAGLLPIFTHCILCGDVQRSNGSGAEALPVFFSARQGGIVCRKCDRNEIGTIRISSGTVQSVLFFLKTTPEQAVKLCLSQQTERELESISQKFLQFRLEHPLRTAHFLSEVKPLFR